MTYSARTRLFWLSIAIFVIIAPPVLFYATGWRITSGFDIERTGGLFIAVPESGSKVYLDGDLERETNFLQSGTLIQNLTPRTYSVLVAKDGYWPWTKNLLIKGSTVVEARALLVPQTVEGTPVTKAAAEYKTALTAIRNADALATTTPTGPRYGLAKDERGRTEIWWDQNQHIWIEWLATSPLPYYLDQQKKIVFQSRSPLHGIAFYPSRDDVILFATENSVFALELDSRGTQNFQPVYKGADPSLARVGDAIYILDQSALVRIAL
ncbi:MAG: hypothetical protein HYS44_01250 [Candidatus Niyogibacteria bacterium]|nr:hypothetical protein [Candidatus Niyogibacteria bacterium]